MEKKVTQRGFTYYEFTDTYEIPCSLQQSSSSDPNIWFGTDPNTMTIFEDRNKGKYVKTPIPETFLLTTRMHLSQEQVKTLLPYLQKFAETGSIE